MTAEERVDNILERFRAIGNMVESIKWLRAQIREAEKETYIDAMKDWELKASEEMKKIQFELGRASMREEAARVCDGVCFCENECKAPSDYHDIECNACDCALRIRAIPLEGK